MDCLNGLTVSGVWERVGTTDRGAETDRVADLYGIEVPDSSSPSVYNQIPSYSINNKIGSEFAYNEETQNVLSILMLPSGIFIIFQSGFVTSLDGPGIIFIQKNTLIFI